MHNEKINASVRSKQFKFDFQFYSYNVTIRTLCIIFINYSIPIFVLFLFRM